MGKIDRNGQFEEPTDKPGFDGFSGAGHSGAFDDPDRGLRRKVFDLYTIFEISRHLNSMLDVDPLLDAILFTCIGQMGVSGAAIVVQQPSSSELSKLHLKGLTLPESMSRRFSRVGPLVRHLQRSAKPQLRRDLENEVPDNSDDFERLKAMETELIVPLIVKGSLLGILFLPKKLSGLPYHEDDLEFVSILVNQLSVALDNARLYESRMKALTDLRSAQKRLIETERLAALGKMSAAVAHEVNNPLGIIRNYLTIIAKSLTGDTENMKNLEIVQEEVGRIAGIVKRLLDFYRPALEQSVEFDICESLESTLNLINSKFESSGIEVIQDFGEILGKVVGSPDKLKQVFLNLLLNSRDAMPDGGRITISARKFDGFVEIDFADSGRGISDEDLPRIFEPFYTTKKNSGTGLGLAVCFGIIRSHKGVISAERNADGGATFKIKLPIRERNG